MHEALDASCLTTQGWDVSAIRAYIDRKYRG